MDQNLFKSLANGLEHRNDKLLDFDLVGASMKRPSMKCMEALQRDILVAISLGRVIVEDQDYHKIREPGFVRTMYELLEEINNLNLVRTTSKPTTSGRIRKHFPVFDVYATMELIYFLIMRHIVNMENLSKFQFNGRDIHELFHNTRIDDCYLDSWDAPDAFNLTGPLKEYVLRPPCDTCLRHGLRCDTFKPCCYVCQTLRTSNCVSSQSYLVTNVNDECPIVSTVTTDSLQFGDGNQLIFNTSSGDVDERDYVIVWDYIKANIPVQTYTTNIVTSLTLYILATTRKMWDQTSLGHRSDIIVGLMQRDVLKVRGGDSGENSCIDLECLKSVIVQSLTKFRSPIINNTIGTGTGIDTGTGTGIDTNNQE